MSGEPSSRIEWWDQSLFDQETSRVAEAEGAANVGAGPAQATDPEAEVVQATEPMQATDHQVEAEPEARGKAEPDQATSQVAEAEPDQATSQASEAAVEEQMETDQASPREWWDDSFQAELEATEQPEASQEWWDDSFDATDEALPLGKYF